MMENYLQSGTCMHAKKKNVFALTVACNQVLYCVISAEKNEIKCSGHFSLYADVIIYSKQIAMSSGEYFLLNLSIDSLVV